MVFDMKSYMAGWRQKHPDRVSASNKRWREANPQYAKAWRDKHPNYQRLYRSKDPNHRKLWDIKFPNRSADVQAKAKAMLTHLGNERIQQKSFVEPILEEYAQFPTIAQQMMKLCGCKYLINNMFCNSVKLDGKPYCSVHSNICYLHGIHTDK